MKATQAISKKIFTLPELQKQVAAWRVNGKSIAFTNGCFDILHEGHIFSLNEAANEADILIIGLNSDESVKKLKGPERPVNKEQSRSLILSNLIVVDAVIIFNEDTPLSLIKALMPDVIVKGGDYTISQIVGSKEVINNGGRVVINKIINGFSTTGIIEQIKSSYS